MPWRPRWLRSQVLMLNYAGGVAGGDPGKHGVFYLGGYPAQNLLTSIYDFSRPGSAALRGYPYASLIGDQMHVLNVEYRFPITWIEWGYQTLPLYFKRLHGRVFADYGGAFFGPFSFDKLHLGVGGELCSKSCTAGSSPPRCSSATPTVSTKAGDIRSILLNNPFEP